MTMASATKLPDFYAGNTVSYDMTFKDQNGTAIDISLDLMFMTLKHSPDDDDVNAALQKQIQFPSDANSIAGLGTFTLDSTDTEGLSEGSYYFDFQRVVDGSSPLEVYTHASGTVNVKKRITQATS